MPNPIMPSSHRLAQAISATKNTADALSQQTYGFQPITKFGANVVANTTFPPIATPQYRVEGGGVQLRCRGSIMATGNIASGATLFTLPYAPDETGVFASYYLQSGVVGTFALEVVALTGAVTLPPGLTLVANVVVYLDPISIGILT
jgi:hypothetical protein